MKISRWTSVKKDDAIYMYSACRAKGDGKNGVLIIRLYSAKTFTPLRSDVFIFRLAAGLVGYS